MEEEFKIPEVEVIRVNKYGEIRREWMKVTEALTLYELDILTGTYWKKMKIIPHGIDLRQWDYSL